jgi:dUTP pyrophosphatase
MKLRIQKLHPAAQEPQYSTDGAACFDLVAVDVQTHSHVRRSHPITLRTGLAFEVPEGYVMLIYSRSGHGFKNGVRLANCVGIIDSDYRGEVMVRLTADDPCCADLIVHEGDRIAQAMLMPVPRVEFEVCEQLTLTDRGEGAFGSTGK